MTLEQLKQEIIDESIVTRSYSIKIMKINKHYIVGYLAALRWIQNLINKSEDK